MRSEECWGTQVGTTNNGNPPPIHARAEKCELTQQFSGRFKGNSVEHLSGGGLYSITLVY